MAPRLRDLTLALALLTSTLAQGCWTLRDPDERLDRPIADSGAGSETAVDVATDITTDITTDTAADVPGDAAMDVTTDVSMDAAVDAAMDRPDGGAADAATDLPPADDAATDLPPADDAATDLGGVVTRDVPGDTRVDASGPIPAPRAIYPLSGSVVTSQQPTLHWALPPGVDGALVEISATRDFASPVTLTVRGGLTSATLASPLANSNAVFYWRLRGMVGTTTAPATAASAPWTFIVTAHSAATVNRGSGTSLQDLTGDGLADLVIGDPTAGNMKIYRGFMASVLPTVPNFTLGSGIGGFGVNLALGDVTGDGLADVAVVARSTGSPELRLYRGVSNDMPMPQTSTTFAGASTRFGEGITVGFFNGDTFADVAVGDPEINQVTVLYGLPSGLSNEAGRSLVLRGDAGDFGASLGATDVNGDGFHDLIVGAPAGATGGTVRVYHGSTSGILPTSLGQVSDLDATARFGSAVCGVGDVDADGYGDVAVGAPATTGSATVPVVRIYRGGIAGLTTTNPWSFPGTMRTLHGAAVAPAGDINGDGAADLLVGAPAENAGYVRVYLGDPMGGTPRLVNYNGPSAAGGMYGRRVAGIGDANGDGYLEIAIASSPEVRIYQGAVTLTNTAFRTYTINAGGLH